MIYKFIDTNGSEISVNSISSLQSLVDSETIKKTTKVKPGLRGQWTTAANIIELVFPESEYDETEEILDSAVDIKSFITNHQQTEDVTEEEDKEDAIEEEKTEDVTEEEDKEDVIEEEKTEDVTEEEDKEDVIEEEKLNNEKIQTIKDIENLDFEIENKEWIKSKK